MRKIILFTILGIIFLTGITYALRIPKPKHITELNNSSIVAINENFDKLWEVTNGRFNFNSTTTNPDGDTIGKKNDAVILYSGGNYYLEVNVDNSTTWRGVQLTDIP